MSEGNCNIQVEITDASEFHCFRLLLNPEGHEPTCPAGMIPQAGCFCKAAGSGVRLEIMFHARSLVDLIHKSSVALCDWQAQTTGYLLDRTTGGALLIPPRRCSACQGTGRVDHGYCGCAMGRDLERVEKRGVVEPVTGGEE